MTQVSLCHMSHYRHVKLSHKIVPKVQITLNFLNYTKFSK
jgi:hypothetical protein